MNVKQMKSILKSNKYDNCECNFKLKGGHKITLEDVMKEMHKGFNRLDARIDNLETRFDNLVKVNKLKE